MLEEGVVGGPRHARTVHAERSRGKPEWTGHARPSTVPAVPRSLPIVSGRRFGCTRCGNCCVEDGYVHMTHFELRAMASHLGVEPAEFRRRYRVQGASHTGGLYIEVKDGKGCPLLTSDRRCTVHPVKPSQCSTWPFWSEMIQDAAEWERCKSYCPGLDAEGGRLYSEAEIRELAERGGRTHEVD